MRHPVPRYAMHACVLLIAAAATQPECSVARAADVYDVDAGSSDIHWLVYKAGVLAPLGHNHVISVGKLSGTVTRHADTSRSTFELSIPVSGLVVDDSALRDLHGDNFRSTPSAKDVAGTRRNMLGERVLDAANYPTIRVDGKIRAGELESAMLDITVQMLGRVISLSVPSHIVIGGNTVVASGEFSVTHADLGMKPFKSALGTLAIGQQIDFFYRVRAVEADMTSP